MGFMANNYTLTLTLRSLSTINPWLLCSNYNLYSTTCPIISEKLVPGGTNLGGSKLNMTE